MTDQLKGLVQDNQPETGTDEALVYQIRIKGYLSPQWTEWFEGLSITPLESGETLLTGPVVDQAALYGLIRKLRDLGLTLLSVNKTESG